MYNDEDKCVVWKFFFSHTVFFVSRYVFLDQSLLTWRENNSKIPFISTFWMNVFFFIVFFISPAFKTSQIITSNVVLFIKKRLYTTQQSSRSVEKTDFCVGRVYCFFSSFISFTVCLTFNKEVSATRQRNRKKHTKRNKRKNSIGVESEKKAKSEENNIQIGLLYKSLVTSAMDERKNQINSLFCSRLLSLCHNVNCVPFTLRFVN